jgi:hypothetical protein
MAGAPGFRVGQDRAIDVKLAQANVRQAEMEALRLADRLLHDERTDPSIEKKVIIQGGPAGPVVPVDDPN